MKAGDSLDLGPSGLLVYYGEPEATAIRILADERQRRVREAIDFSEAKGRQQVEVERRRSSEGG